MNEKLFITGSYQNAKSGWLPPDTFIKEVISMKQVERYFYPAVFTYEPDQEIAVDFPDLKSQVLQDALKTQLHLG